MGGWHTWEQLTEGSDNNNKWSLIVFSSSSWQQQDVPIIIISSLRMCLCCHYCWGCEHTEVVLTRNLEFQFFWIQSHLEKSEETLWGNSTHTVHFGMQAGQHHDTLHPRGPRWCGTMIELKLLLLLLPPLSSLCDGMIMRGNHIWFLKLDEDYTDLTSLSRRRGSLPLVLYDCHESSLSPRDCRWEVIRHCLQVSAK